MARTLKEQHEINKVQKLRERLRYVDIRTISEVKETQQFETGVRLVLEAWDEQQVQATTDIIKKLKAIDFKGIDALANARDAAIKDVTTMMLTGKEEAEKTGESTKSDAVLKWAANKFRKKGEDNPLAYTIAFAAALQNFFQQFEQFISSLGGDDKEKIANLVSFSTKESISRSNNVISEFAPSQQPKTTTTSAKKTTTSAKTSTEKGAPVPSKKTPEENVKQQIDDPAAEKRTSEMLVTTLNKHLKPQGKIASLGTTWFSKYIGGDAGIKKIANQISKMTLGDLKATTSQILGSTKNATTLGDAAVGAAQQGATATTDTTGGEQTKTTDKTGAAKGTEPTTKDSKGEEPEEKKAGGKGNVKAAVNQTVATAFGKGNMKVALEKLGIKKDSYRMLMKTLIKGGHIKEAREIKNLIMDFC